MKKMEKFGELYVRLNDDRPRDFMKEIIHSYEINKGPSLKIKQNSNSNIFMFIKFLVFS